MGIPARALADARARGLFRVRSPALRADNSVFYMSNIACEFSVGGARLNYGEGDTAMTTDQQTAAMAGLYKALAAQEGRPKSVREMSVWRRPDDALAGPGRNAAATHVDSRTSLYA